MPWTACPAPRLRLRSRHAARAILPVMPMLAILPILSIPPIPSILATLPFLLILPVLAILPSLPILSDCLALSALSGQAACDYCHLRAHAQHGREWHGRLAQLPPSRAQGPALTEQPPQMNDHAWSTCTAASCAVQQKPGAQRAGRDPEAAAQCCSRHVSQRAELQLTCVVHKHDNPPEGRLGDVRVRP